MDISPELYGVMTGPLFLFLVAFSYLLHVMSTQSTYLDKLLHIKWAMVAYSGVTSVAVLILGLVSDTWQAVVLLALVGVFSSGIVPAFSKQVSRCFAPGQRALAFSFFQTRIYFGRALASLSIFPAYYLGWRSAFFIVSGGGVLCCALSMFLLRNEATNHTSRLLEPNLLDKLGTLKNPTVLLVMLANLLRFSAGLARSFYEALYFAGQFPEHIHKYSVINSLALLLCPFSLYLTGKLADRKEQTHNFKWLPLICSFTNVFCVPFVVLMYSTSSFELACLGLVVAFVVGETYSSVNISIVLNVTPKHMHAFESGVLLCVSMTGGVVSCLVLGCLFKDLDSLRKGILWIVVFGFAASGVCFFVTSFLYDRNRRLFVNAN